MLSTSARYRPRGDGDVGFVVFSGMVFAHQSARAFELFAALRVVGIEGDGLLEEFDRLLAQSLEQQVAAEVRAGKDKKG